MDPNFLGGHLKLELEEMDEIQQAARINISQHMNEKYLSPTKKYTVNVNREIRYPQCWMERLMLGGPTCAAPCSLSNTA